jgi:hypothetical protein
MAVRKTFKSGHSADSKLMVELRIMDKTASEGWGFKFGYLDLMHEQLHMHPRTPEELLHKVQLYQIFDDPKYDSNCFSSICTGLVPDSCTTIQGHDIKYMHNF